MQHNLWTAKPLLRFGLLANDVATAVIIATSTTWRNKPKRRRVAALQSQAKAPDKKQIPCIPPPVLPGKCTISCKVN